MRTLTDIKACLNHHKEKIKNLFQILFFANEIFNRPFYSSLKPGLTMHINKIKNKHFKTKWRLQHKKKKRCTIMSATLDWPGSALRRALLIQSLGSNPSPEKAATSILSEIRSYTTHLQYRDKSNLFQTVITERLFEGFCMLWQFMK